MADQRDGAHLMQGLGAALIDPNAGTILQSWDAMPRVITHAGEDRTGAIIGAEFAGGCLLVARFLEADPVPGAPITGQSERIEDGKVIVSRTYGEQDLSSFKAAAKARINAAAGAARLRYITDAPGQEMTYDRKRREAMQALGDPSPTAQNYPLLFASIGVEVPDTGNAKADCDAISNLVMSKERLLALAGAAIERVRLGANKAVDDATTLAAIQAAEQVSYA